MGLPLQDRLDFDARLDVQESIAPAAARTTSTNGADSKNCTTHARTAVIFDFGTVTDGSYTPTVEESDTGTGSWTTATITGDTAAVTAAGVAVVGVTRTKKYLRAVVTASGTTTGATYSAVIVGELAKIAG